MPAPADAQPYPDAAAALVGREREQAALRAALGRTLTGQGGLVLISGEAGIGKTALAEHLCRVAEEQSALVLVGRCYDLSETPPYGPWRDVFATAPRDTALPVLPSAVLLPEQPGEALTSQAAIVARVQAYLAALAAQQPLVVLLDDLHWADPASLDLLRVLGRGLATLPLLLLVTYRDDEVARDHPLYTFLPLLVREARATRLALHPLDGAGLRVLVAARYGLAEREERRLVTYLDERAAGNPFFIGELLRSLEESEMLCQTTHGWTLTEFAAPRVPPLLRQVIDARVDRLGETARDLLAVAAVLGQAVPLGLWVAAAGAAEEALLDVAERAAAARLLDATTTGVHFVHALIREALYEGIPPLRRRGWHQRAATALLARPDPDPDAVAYHLQQAGDLRAADWLLRAGERAQRAYAWLTAAERYEAALALLAGGAPRPRADLLLRLAQMYRYADPRRGAACLEDAARLAAEADDAALAAEVAFDLGHLRCLAGDQRRGLGEMRTALPALEALPAAARARLVAPAVLGEAAGADYHRGALVSQLAWNGRLAEAGTVVAALARRGPAMSPRGLEGLAHLHAWRGEPAAAQAAFAAAQAAFREAGQLGALYTNLRMEVALVVVPYQADDAAARRRVSTAQVELDIARALNVAPPLGVSRLPLLVLAGAWAEARALARHPFGQLSGAALARARDEPARAWAVVASVLPGGPATEPGNSIPSSFGAALEVQRLAAALALDAGDLATARAWLEAHDRWLAWSGAVLGLADGHLGWAAYYRAAGDLAAAHEHAETALMHASAPRQPLALLAAHRLLGELATEVGRHTEAATHLAAALALADACAAPYERALCLLALAELHAASGAREPAMRALGEARAILVPLAARPALARADALAMRLSATTPAAARPAGLSPREVEVLRLVAEGLTNAQIAQHLYLSPRTVDQHLRSIYNKLGAENRAAAARWAAEHALTGTAP